jgi:hypothetical protein
MCTLKSSRQGTSWCCSTCTHSSGFDSNCQMAAHSYRTAKPAAAPAPRHTTHLTTSCNGPARPACPTCMHDQHVATPQRQPQDHNRQLPYIPHITRHASYTPAYAIYPPPPPPAQPIPALARVESCPTLSLVLRLRATRQQTSQR